MSRKINCESSNAQDKNMEEKCQTNLHKIATKKEKQKGRWTNAEQLKYFLFVIHHKKSFEEDEARRTLRMYKHMSMFIKTRNPTQCRIRHMKTLKKFGGIEKSIESFTSIRPQFFEIYEKTKDYLQLIEDRAYCGDFENYENQPTLSDEAMESSDQNPVKIEEIEVEENKKDPTPSLETRFAPENAPNNFYWHSVIAFQPIFYYM